MAACILRIDLSAAARDFQLVAIEPGVPLLDRTGANYATLRRWLGTFVAEPVWEADDSVLFYIADERGGRLEQVDCSPATRTDLEGPLREEVDAFLVRLGKIKPVTDFEKQLLPLINQRLSSLRGQGHGGEDCQFFKCRRGKKDWRLVWCWPQKRKDLQPAAAVICQREDCSQLYLVRRGTKARCPRCSAAALTAPRSSSRRKLAWAALALLLLLVGGGGAYLATGPQELSVVPEQWSGPAGSRIPFTVMERRWRIFNRDVTSQAVPQSHDRRKLEFEPDSTLAKALAPGKTSATFFLDDHEVEAPIEIGPPKAPELLVIEPSSVSVPVGGTAAVKVIGRYGKDLAIDLSAAVAWLPQDTSVATLSGERVEGRAEGKTAFKARFKGIPDAAPEASVFVTVTPAELKSLAIRFDPPSLAVGGRSKFRVLATDAVGKEHEISGSSQLQLQVTPAKAAEINADWLVAREPGPATLSATLGKLTTAAPLEISPAATNQPLAEKVLSVQPEHLEMAVYETLPLSIVAGGSEPVELSSSNPEVVDVFADDDMVVGRGVGQAEITVSQGDKHKTVKVTVVDSPISALHIEPSQAEVGVDGDLQLRVVATTKSGVDLLVTPDRLKWKSLPSEAYAQFDPDTLQLHGVAVTPKDQELIAELAPGQTAAAKVRVVAATVPQQPLVKNGTTKPLGTGLPPDRLAGSNRVGTHEAIDLGNTVGGVGGIGGLGHGIGKYGPGHGHGGVKRVGGKVIGTDHRNDKVVVGNGGVGKTVGSDHVTVHDGRTVIRSGGRTVVGTDDRTIDLDEDALVVRDVKLLGVHISQIKPQNFHADFDLALTQRGEYRLVDAKGRALSDWTALGPSDNATLSADSMQRTRDDEYEPSVERKIDGKVKSFQLSFALKLKDS